MESELVAQAKPAMGTTWKLRFWRKRSKRWIQPRHARKTVVPPGKDPRVHDGGVKLVAAYGGCYDGSFEAWGCGIARALVAFEASKPAAYTAKACVKDCTARMREGEMARHIKYHVRKGSAVEFETQFGRSDEGVDHLHDDYAYEVYVDETAKCVMFEAWRPISFGWSPFDQRGNTTRICIEPERFPELFDGSDSDSDSDAGSK